MSHELKAWRKGFRNIAGVDETGRGPLAGPVVVSAVILGRNWNENHRLDDSKALKVKEREELYEIICQEALAVSTVSMSAELVDRLNVLQASLQGMKKAVERLNPKADYALIDGNRYPEMKLPGEALVKGDSRSASIAAASIVGKVVRDRVMQGMECLYPGWGFERHKGYPTQEHREILQKRKPSMIHRHSFQYVGNSEDLIQPSLF
ncbi:MAG: ribonuclease HII [Deltaproteobacteria bacterium]